MAENFGVIGGDKRQIALAESIAADGYNVYTFGFDLAPEIKGAKEVQLSDAALICDCIILPLPVTHDGCHLNAPFCSEQILLDHSFASFFRSKKVYGGMMDQLYQTSDIWDEIDTSDYNSREEFAIRNAGVTAEGSIEIAMREYPGALGKSKCLVAGYGRIGKALSWMLRGIGADVTVSARSQKDFAWIDVFGYHGVHTAKLCEKDRYDIIFNTVPALTFTRRVLSRIPSDTLMIELASAPGGIDCKAAEKLGIRVIQGPSLPGRAAPKAAGEIIKNTIYNMMEE